MEKDKVNKANKPVTGSPVRGLPTQRNLSHRKAIGDMQGQLNEIKAVLRHVAGVQQGEMDRVDYVLIRGKAHEKILLSYTHDHLSWIQTTGNRLRQWVVKIVYTGMDRLNREGFDTYVKSVAEDEQRKANVRAKTAKEDADKKTEHSPNPPAVSA